MTRKFVNLLFAGFVLHILISFIIIVWSSFLPDTWFSRTYNTYVLPGPFFKNDRITTTVNLNVSWKKDGAWSKPFNHAKKYFDQYHKNFNPVDLYRSRYVKSMDQVFFFNELGLSKADDAKRMRLFIPVFYKQHIPPDADSIRVMVTKEYTIDYWVKLDTLYPKP